MEDALVVALLSGEDGTFDALGNRVEYDHGFQVGGYAPTLKDPTEEELRDWLAGPGAYPYPEYGAWTDENGVLHVDVARYFRTLPVAVSVADRHEEDAIWSWDLRAAIPLYPTLP